MLYPLSSSFSLRPTRFTSQAQSLEQEAQTIAEAIEANARPGIVNYSLQDEHGQIQEADIDGIRLSLPLSQAIRKAPQLFYVHTLNGTYVQGSAENSGRLTYVPPLSKQ